MTTYTSPDRAAPTTVLLATDLSARGDRALERAVAICTERNAQLVIVHVFEELEEASLTYSKRPAPSWRRPPDAGAIAKQRIQHGLRADLGSAVEAAKVLIEDGAPADVIERVAESERADLVVVGIAREGLFASRPVVLGKTAESLVRRLQVPILVVRNRAREPYRHIAVATDFSDASAYALQTALRFFPDRTLHLLHASIAPYSTHVSDPQRHAESHLAALDAQFGEFLAALPLADAERDRLVTLVEPGAPEQIVRDYVRVHDADLVVLGTRGRGMMLEAVLGSTSKSILSSLPCDALLVRKPRT